MKTGALWRSPAALAAASISNLHCSGSVHLLAFYSHSGAEEFAWQIALISWDSTKPAARGSKAEYL